MSTWNINFTEQTATSINGITFKLTKINPGEFKGVCINPKAISPDDVGGAILAWRVKEAEMFYRMELEREN